MSTVSSITLQKKPRGHHLLCHLLSRPPSQCQMQTQFDLQVSSIREYLLFQFHLADFKCYVYPLDRVPLESNTLLPMLQAISLNMAVKNNSTETVDPSNFLWTLKHKLSNLRGVPLILIPRKLQQRYY